MFTLCWSSDVSSNWDMFNTVEEVEEKVKELMKEGCCTDDMMMFPRVIDYVVPEEDGAIVY